MVSLSGFPTRGVLRRPALRPVDLSVTVGLLALLYGLLRLGHGLRAPLVLANVPAHVSTDPASLPYYAARSLLRMFIALVLSVASRSPTRRRPPGCGGPSRSSPAACASGSGSPGTWWWSRTCC